MADEHTINQTPETGAETLLSVQNLTVSADGKTILHDVDLAVGAGETHVIMGPNGAGKSTLGHVVMGDAAYDVEDGAVVFDGIDVTDLSPDKRSRAGLFLSFQAPVEIPGVPVSSFLRAAAAGREGVGDLKGKQFRKHVRELAGELDMDPAYLDRELGVGFSGGEKKKLEMLQLLLLRPKLAILDETDSGLDVDALGVVSRGIDAYRRTADGALVIITHNTRILEHLDVDRVHVMVRGRMVAEGDASLVARIDEHGFEQFEQAAPDAAPDERAEAAPVAAAC
ncbi:Fe-S cluster assembly ATPase SufC [Gordonibacter sp. 28C]|uniref:Fe-S cluster assembly ATPase SufC n=1 Tax=Gordonibacter sp. 28C TaxID=2078569 RepID=UPI000DF733E5|nr:Fe-S cluster assembly ATPase SufC [Gordonibacter sp. 28C]RDB60430.1 Fe-S cluster assembly ATPase SufC [Gordonibacter sp. 28C]